MHMVEMWYDKGKDCMIKKQKKQKEHIDLHNNNPILNITKEDIKTILPWFVIALSTIITFTIYINTIRNDVDYLKADLENTKKLMEEITQNSEESLGNLTSISEQLSNMKEYNEKSLESLGTRLEILEDRIYDVVSLVATEAATSSLKIRYDEEKKYVMQTTPLLSSSPEWELEEVIATDIKTGELFTAKELVAEKVILSYTENGQEIYFCGQYNENNNWDGECIINAYENNQLVSILDAEYDNGNLLKYKQVIRCTSRSEGNIWMVSERIRMDNYRKGENWSYLRQKEVKKEFHSEEVAYENILSVREFKNQISAPLIGYYHGNISEGYFNDTTGNAYLVKYFPDGTVRMLYYGNIKDGDLHDTTGDAWYIVREENTDYMYYKGHFENGKAKDNEGSVFENNLTQERIQDILGERIFNCKLLWYFPKDT